MYRVRNTIMHRVKDTIMRRIFIRRQYIYKLSQKNELQFKISSIKDYMMNINRKTWNI